MVSDDDLPACVNEVVLVGRLGSTVNRRELPSGDVLTVFTVIVDRARRGREAPRVDAIACQTLRASVADRVERWEPGRWVRVEGALQRRFWRGSTGLASATEVTVTSLSSVPR
jgi:single-strand DNA-binding protein